MKASLVVSYNMIDKGNFSRLWLWKCTALEAAWGQRRKDPFKPICYGINSCTKERKQSSYATNKWTEL